MEWGPMKMEWKWNGNGRFSHMDDILNLKRLKLLKTHF